MNHLKNLEWDPLPEWRSKCDASLQTMKDLVGRGNLLNQRQCEDLTSKLTMINENVHLIVQRYESFPSYSHRFWGPSSKRNYYRCLEKAKMIVTNCGEKEWWRAAAFQWQNVNAFLEILLDASLCYNVIYEQAKYKDKETTHPDDLRQSAVFEPATDSAVREDEESLISMLEQLIKDPGAIESEDLSCPEELARAQALARFLTNRFTSDQSVVNDQQEENGIGIMWDDHMEPPGTWGEVCDRKERGFVKTVSTEWLGIPCFRKEFLAYDNEDDTNMFLKEASITAHMKHPNIIRYLFHGNSQKPKCHFIGTELMEMSLSKLIEEQGGEPFPMDMTIDIIKQIARGMSYLHDQGVAHRNLRPKNVVIKKWGSPDFKGYCDVKLVEFGISKIDVDDSRLNTIDSSGIESVQYDAPELHPIAKSYSKRVMFKADVYSFAMTCVHILSLQAPFEELKKYRYESYEIYDEVMDGRSPILPKCPSKLKKLLKHCWQILPHERPTFVEICENLVQIREDGEMFPMCMKKVKQSHVDFIIKKIGAQSDHYKSLPKVIRLIKQLDDEVHNTSYKEPFGEVTIGEQKFGEELQGTRGGAVSNTTFPLILLQPTNIEANLETFDKLAIAHRDMGEESGVGKVGMMEKLTKYFEIIEVCEEGVRKMGSLKFNKAQCEYLAIKLDTTVKIARSFLYTRQTHPNEMYSILDIERWVEVFKFMLVLSKQVEGFFQDCSKNAWIQAAMTMANVGEYVSTLGFNLELCKIGLQKEGSISTLYYTMNEVGKLNDDEVRSIDPSVVGDKVFLLNKTSEVSHSTNFEDAKLAKYLLLKLQGDVGDPSIDNDNSTFLKMVLEGFKWVKNIRGKVHQIGKGASAKVYKVMWFDTLVAKKTFLGFNNPVFRQEAKILSQLHHPNITSIFCCNMTERGCSIIMELMDGSLYDLLQSRTTDDGSFDRFSDLEEVNLMLQVGDGVNYLHQQFFVHRDLKSENILVKGVEVSSAGVDYVQAKVADFGLSKTKETSTSYSNMTYNVGTSRWMAPEIIRLKEGKNMDCEGFERLLKYNYKGDVYSFGMVCYEILTGEVPFKSEESEKVVKQMVLDGLRPTLPEHCPQRLAKLIKKCWSKEPQLRPSMNEVCLELKYMKYLLLIGEVFEEALEPLEEMSNTS